ncbi:MAG: hypothetical protein R3A13_01410 [Bdellovibrionota bacterium]
MSDETFKLERVRGAPVTDEELLSDLVRVAEETESDTVSQPTYKKYGKYHDRTISRRFETWNNALQAANLSLSNEVNISDERLFENLLNIWQHLGKQPRRRDLSEPFSEFSQTPYNRRFGSWSKALEAFIDFANKSELENVSIDESVPAPGLLEGIRHFALDTKY